MCVCVFSSELSCLLMMTSLLRANWTQTQTLVLVQTLVQVQVQRVAVNNKEEEATPQCGEECHSFIINIDLQYSVYC